MVLSRILSFTSAFRFVLLPLPPYSARTILLNVWRLVIVLVRLGLRRLSTNGSAGRSVLLRIQTLRETGKCMRIILLFLVLKNALHTAMRIFLKDLVCVYMFARI